MNTKKLTLTDATPEEAKQLHDLMPHLFEAPPEPKPSAFDWEMPSWGYKGASFKRSGAHSARIRVGFKTRSQGDIHLDASEIKVLATALMALSEEMVRDQS